MQTTMRFTSWDEDPAYGPDAPLPRLATAVVAFAHEGDLTGTSECRYVLRYAADGTGEGVGYEVVTTDDGAVTLRHDARFTAEGVEADVTVVDADGTHAGLRGTGRYAVGHGTESWPLVLDTGR
jgi:hypothetical protein